MLKLSGDHPAEMESQAPAPVISAAELRHRLRTPLNHVIGYSEILIEDYPDYAPRLETLLGEANLMLEAIQQTAGTDHQEILVAAVDRLRTLTAGGIARMRRTVEDLRARLPEEAHPDLDRIAAALGVLIDGLSADKGGNPATLPAPNASRELRLDSVSGPGRILIVDDNEANRDMLSRQLDRQRHDVATASDGATALAMLKGQPYDIVLLDLMMPGMSGFEVLQAIRADPALSNVAVILVSALDEMDSVVSCIEAGAEDYLFKPVNPTLLRARLKSTLDKQRADEAVRRKQRLESIGLLAAGVAHDFNNLLTGVIGHAQILEQTLVLADDREMAHSIVEAGERAAELTKQLLAYAGKAPLQMKPLDLAGVIRASEGLIRASLPKRVQLEFRLANAPMVVADANQVRQALLNLTLNAGESFADDCTGTVCVETGMEYVEGTHFDVMPDQPVAGQFGWFEVRDTGCGMDQATASKIFEPFFSTKFLGRGLGLAAVAGIVRAHRGFLRVRSAPGDGAALRIYFMLARPEPVAEENQPTGETILVVDDEAIVRQIVKVALERAGYKVILAASGEEAIERFRELRGQVGAVLLDWKMPGMDGASTLEQLRNIEGDLKVIVSSGFARTDAEERFGTARISGYLQKPYRISELTETLKSALLG